MSPEVLTICDALENELVSIGLERDVAETDDKYTAFLSDADATAGRAEFPYALLKQAHRDATGPQAAEACERRLKRLMQILRQQGRAALCFSGGGIRSATFCLGALQGMAHQKLLSRFDYLSTVSGGGYIGGWLSRWLARGGENGDGTNIREVEQKLANAPTAKIDGELPQVGFLRSYSNYLSPQTGLLSADVWTLAATVVRNMLLNWMILVPMLAVALLVPYVALSVARAMHHPPKQFLWVLLALGFGCGVRALLAVGSNLPSVAGGRGCSQSEYLKKILIPLVISAILFDTVWIGFSRSGGQFHQWQFAAFGALFHLIGWLGISGLGVAAFGKRKATNAAAKPADGLKLFATDWATWFALVSGAAGGELAYVVSQFLNPVEHPERATWLALPVTLAIYFLATSLFIGLASKKTSDDDREWWARSGGWILMVSLGWLAFAGLAIYGPFLIEKLNPSVVGGGGFLSGWLGSLVGKSSKTDSGRSGPHKDPKSGEVAAKIPLSDRLLEFAGKLAPVVFLVCLLISIAKLTDVLITGTLAPLVSELPFWPVWLDAAPFAVVALMGGLALLAGIMSGYVNINTFSLHAMYRSRLIRAYLGASNAGRDPNQFTGFDPNDNVRMHKLSPRKPFHVVNIALNIVRGKRLAWQQRKAATFTITRLHAGSPRVGYQSTARYGDSDGISLGTAMALSGAAASPNMGYHSSPLLTFLMTFFNARLGWWLPNPGPSGKGLWSERGPKSALKSLVGETFGLTDDSSPYVYLSDGGHFENLGLYEMVLRRCTTIVVIDASGDPNYEFGDLANAIRKIRVDLGVSIRLDKPMKMVAGGNSANVHCATGEIAYSCTDGAGVNGTLIYIKPVMDDWQSVDIDNYHIENREFPQQPTSDQFFDESQFEAYRRLGFETVERICHGAEKQEDGLGEFIKLAAAHGGEKKQAFRAAC